QTHGCVLENEWPAFIAMARKTRRLISVDGLDATRQYSAVWIVAIHARHRAFRQTVTKRPLEAGPYVRMASGALRVHFGSPPAHESGSVRLMHGMACNTAHLIFHMAALNAPAVSGLIQVTGETDAIGGRRFQLARVADVRR